mmetsp:Transcript_29408/g.75018  ORF Transcript_29408/g.75018 Transcript_29408/m.75018 type:complete len:214 (-) Transcript_29408:1421-2062(-)
MWVATRSRNQRSCEMMREVPAKFSIASSRQRSVATSRSLVGSSSSSRLPLCLSVLARCSRLRSPPDSCPTFFCWSRPLKLYQEQYARVGTERPDRSTSSLPSLISSYTERSGLSAARLWSTYMGTTVSPSSRVPLSGVSCPMIMRNSVDLPAPLPPMMPTTAPGGTLNVMSSTSSLSPNDLHTPATSSTLLPRRGPTGMVMESTWLVLTNSDA